MDAVAALRHLGGTACAGDVLALTTRRRLRTATEAGDVVRVARGRYALATTRGQWRIAAARSATLSHLSAAQHHGWSLKHAPEAAWLTVPRNRKVAREVQAQHEVAYADLTDAEVEGGVTAPLRTVVDCARRLPLDEALCVADSALREGAVTRAELLEDVARLRGRGASAARLVATHADGRAANAFESVLRAIVIETGVLDVVPQLPVATRAMTFHPDLVDARRRVVVEADSWGFHGDHRTHGRDCVRHTALAVAGWVVLRFTWEQVMHSAPYVRAVLHDLQQRLAS